MANRETSTLTSVAVMSANVRELALTVRELAGIVRDHTREIADMRQEMRAGFRSADEHFAELRDLIIDLRD